MNISYEDIKDQKRKEHQKIKEEGLENLRENNLRIEDEIDLKKTLLESENKYLGKKISGSLPIPIPNEFETFTGDLQMDLIGRNEVTARMRELKMADRNCDMNNLLKELRKSYYKSLSSNSTSCYQADERSTILINSLRSIWELHKMKRMLRLPCHLKVEKEIEVNPQGCKGQFILHFKNKEQKFKDCWEAYPVNTVTPRPRIEIFFDDYAYKWKGRLKMYRLQRIRTLSNKHFILSFLYSWRGITLAVLNEDSNRYEKPDFLSFSKIFSKRQKATMQRDLIKDINNLNADTKNELRTEIGNFLSKIDIRFENDLVRWRVVHFVPIVSKRAGKQWNRTLNSLRQSRMLYYILAKYAFERNEGLVEYVPKRNLCPICKSTDVSMGSTFACNKCGRKSNNKYLAIAKNGCIP